MTAPVTVLLPGALRDLVGGASSVTVEYGPDDLTGVLDALDARHPALGRRIRDETGALRRFANVYVDGVDVRAASGLATSVHPGSVVEVVPSVAGG